MLVHYCKTVLCYLLNNKLTAFINLSGIAGAVLLTVPTASYTPGTEPTHNNFQLYQAGSAKRQVLCTQPQAPATSHADSSFLHLFNFPLLHGDLVTATDNIQYRLDYEQLVMIHL